MFFASRFSCNSLKKKALVTYNQNTSTYLSICLSICLSVYLSIYLSFYLPTYLPYNFAEEKGVLPGVYLNLL